MHFGTKNYLKSNRYHTVKYTHNDWCWPPTRSDVMVIVYSVISVVFFPLKSMIRSIENLVQMEKSLPRVLGILLEAKELLYIGIN